MRNSFSIVIAAAFFIFGLPFANASDPELPATASITDVAEGMKTVYFFPGATTHSSKVTSVSCTSLTQDPKGKIYVAPLPTVIVQIYEAFGSEELAGSVTNAMNFAGESFRVDFSNSGVGSPHHAFNITVTPAVDNGFVRVLASTSIIKNLLCEASILDEGANADPFTGIQQLQEVRTKKAKTPKDVEAP